MRRTLKLFIIESKSSIMKVPTIYMKIEWKYKFYVLIPAAIVTLYLY